jgi:HD-GYP domain-containing protein (c-di-GMP phosphodiesterase class II)
MDTKTLLTEAKARFNHNSAKTQLKDKYDSKFIVADQNGLWRANLETINFLNSTNDEELILIDNFSNPVKVDRELLLTKLQNTYTVVMEQWYNEWTELETNR